MSKHGCPNWSTASGTIIIESKPGAGGGSVINEPDREQQKLNAINLVMEAIVPLSPEDRRSVLSAACIFFSLEVSNG